MSKQEGFDCHFEVTSAQPPPTLSFEAEKTERGIRTRKKFFFDKHLDETTDRLAIMNKYFPRDMRCKPATYLLILLTFSCFFPNSGFAGFLTPNDDLSYADEYRVLYLDSFCRIIEESNNREDKFLIELELGIHEAYNKSFFILFDGSCYPHIEWAREQEKNYKWLLSRGNPMVLEEAENRRVYFDQFGFYSKQFHIQYIPAKVTRKGSFFIVEEEPIQ